MLSCPAGNRKTPEGCSGCKWQEHSQDDLVRLLSEVTDILPELLPFEEQFEEVSEYGVAVRYPNGFGEPTLAEASRAYEIAKKVAEIVHLKMKF
jgi:hypothetical protein